MHQLDVYLDFISPYAYLGFHALPEALEGQSVSVNYKPVLFAGMLKHWGQLGPAEVPPKKAWTFRHVLWLGQQAGRSMQAPAAHPFNPLALLRIAVAKGLAQGGDPNRETCRAIFGHVWETGLPADDAQRAADLAQRLHVTDWNTDAVKQRLRENTEEAIAAGVFGVPSVVWQGRVFWGVDGLPMLRAALEGDPRLSDASWAAAESIPAAIERPR